METEGETRMDQFVRTRKKPCANSLVCTGALILLVLGSLSPAVTSAAPGAQPVDLTDFINRMGGWFFETDGSANPIAAKSRDPSAQYWVQVSYSASIPTIGNLTTIKMTQYNQQREDSKGVCSTDSVVTDTVLIDLRELQTAKVTVTAGTIDPRKPQPPQLVSAPSAADAQKVQAAKAGNSPGNPENLKTFKIWSVNLAMNADKPIVRVSRTVTPPTIVGFSAGAGATAPAGGNAAPAVAPGSGTAATCPGLRYGQDIKATTEQADVNTYPIQFANEDEAKYFQMLITSAAPNLNPPRTKNGAP